MLLLIPSKGVVRPTIRDPIILVRNDQRLGVRGPTAD